MSSRNLRILESLNTLLSTKQTMWVVCVKMKYLNKLHSPAPYPNANHYKMKTFIPKLKQGLHTQIVLEVWSSHCGNTHIKQVKCIIWPSRSGNTQTHRAVNHYVGLSGHSLK